MKYICTTPKKAVAIILEATNPNEALKLAKNVFRGAYCSIDTSIISEVEEYKKSPALNVFYKSIRYNKQGGWQTDHNKKLGNSSLPNPSFFGDYQTVIAHNSNSPFLDYKAIFAQEK
jgi:hypothetical protein